jgi:multiple sugar transport system ATP-binding protein
MILVSHDHTEALALGQRIAVLGQGTIQQIGSAREVYTNPRNRYVAEFLGRSSASFFSGGWQRDRDQAWFITHFGRLPVPNWLAGRVGSEVTLGLRADAMSVRPLGESVAVADGADSRQAYWLGMVRWLELREGGSVAYIALRKEMALRLDRPNCVAATDDAGADEAGEGIVVARVATEVRPGDQVRVEVDVDRALWFDARTGQNLAVPQ